ncbi:MAG: J domain-containing protein [candidate division Zixibacteria bacterium]|nr:J domain-containing protein [candidate division Zixibacteria bacterium]
MNIEEYYNYLNVSHSASDEDITAAYKKLAFKFHPDKNPHRVEWANEAMTKLNIAYSTVMSHRFKCETSNHSGTTEKTTPKRERPSEPRPAEKAVIDPEILTKQFIKFRESAKDALYRYFQYSLYSFPIRDKVANQSVFNRIVFSLRMSYHSILHLRNKTDDVELIEHFEVFTTMLFNFYRASECLNIIDSYNNQYDVEAYRVYREGDEHLHMAHKEIFYDRHNRGHFKMDHVYSLLAQAEKIFQASLKIFPDSSWAVETRIKLEYSLSLRKYLELFFTGVS